MFLQFCSTMSNLVFVTAILLPSVSPILLNKSKSDLLLIRAGQDQTSCILAPYILLFHSYFGALCGCIIKFYLICLSSQHFYYGLEQQRAFYHQIVHAPFLVFIACAWLGLESLNKLYLVTLVRANLPYVLSSDIFLSAFLTPFFATVVFSVSSLVCSYSQVLGSVCLFYIQLFIYKYLYALPATAYSFLFSLLAEVVQNRCNLNELLTPY